MHHSGGLHHPRDDRTIVSGGSSPRSLLLTDGSRRTFPAALPPGSASGIRTAPGWQQLSPSWGHGRCCWVTTRQLGEPPEPGQT